MPVQTCQINGVKGHKWGSSGKCYTGPNSASKALSQGVAAIIGGEKMESLKISFDYDDTLTIQKWQDKAKSLIAAGNTVYIISARRNMNNMMKIADELKIPHSRIYATGSNNRKLQKIAELHIDAHYDNNQSVIDKLKGTNTKGIKV